MITSPCLWKHDHNIHRSENIIFSHLYDLYLVNTSIYLFFCWEKDEDIRKVFNKIKWRNYGYLDACRRLWYRFLLLFHLIIVLLHLVACRYLRCCISWFLVFDCRLHSVLLPIVRVLLFFLVYSMMIRSAFVTFFDEFDHNLFLKLNNLLKNAFLPEDHLFWFPSHFRT